MLVVLVSLFHFLHALDLLVVLADAVDAPKNHINTQFNYQKESLKEWTFKYMSNLPVEEACRNTKDAIPLSLVDLEKENKRKGTSEFLHMDQTIGMAQWF